MTDLPAIAKSLVAEGKGIFAADASPKSMAQRGEKVGIDFTSSQTRLAYRQMTLATPGLGKYVGGVILHEEALLFASFLQKENIAIGIKVDKGTVDASTGSSEKITEGLLDLSSRLEDYKARGAVFTKWRAVFSIGPSSPSTQNIETNCKDLARYAYLVQQAGMVPVVEPEVVMEGDHSQERCAEVTRLVGQGLVTALQGEKVDLSAVVYKTNMIVAGKDAVTQESDEQIGEKTAMLIKQFMPTQVPAVVFLSGGQSAVEATSRLNQIVKYGVSVAWRWSFSYERAIEGPAMEAWAKDHDNTKAQNIILHRARCNSLASLGKYTAEVENEI